LPKSASVLNLLALATSRRIAIAQVLLAGEGCNQTRRFFSASSPRTRSKPACAFFHTGFFSSAKKKAPLPVYSG